LGNYTAKQNSCYCSNIHHVEEKNEWSPVTLPFHRIGTNKVIYVINTALMGIVVADYFWFVFLAIYSMVVLQRGPRDHGIILLWDV